MRLGQPEALTASWQRLCAKPDILVAGCEAHVCVLQTVLSLIGAGRRVFVARDAIGSRRSESKETAIRRMEQHHRRNRHHRDGGFRVARHRRSSALPRSLRAGEMSFWHKAPVDAARRFA